MGEGGCGKEERSGTEESGEELRVDGEGECSEPDPSPLVEESMADLDGCAVSLEVPGGHRMGNGLGADGRSCGAYY
jgi:hypothetical protein